MAGGGDTTPDSLFKNVPRRPRSAASRPRKEEPDGGGTRSVSGNVSPPAMTPVASSKRPASSTGAGAEHVPRAKKHRRLVVPVDEPKTEPAKIRGGVGGGALDCHGMLGGMPLALSHEDKAAAAAAAAASSSDQSEPAVDWAENERRRKGKTPVVNGDDDAYAAVARWPPAGSGHGKLLGDAIRAHGSAAGHGGAGGFKPSTTTKPETENEPKKKPAKKDRRTKPMKEKEKTDSSAWFWCGCGTGKDKVSSAGSDEDYSFDSISVVSDRLRTTLRGLGVAAPVRVYGRLLTRCDRDLEHARLLMSGKKWRADGAEFPMCAFLTEKEKEAVHGEGMPLTAYDRGGDAYQIKFRYLDSNGGYRLTSKWVDFLRHNELDVGKDEPAPVEDAAMIDLWLFRSPAGKVGLVMLHYRRGDAKHADAALDEVEQRRLQRMLNNGDAAADAAAVMEDVVGDANEEEEEEDAGVNGEVAAAAPAPSSPSEPNGGGGPTMAAEAAGAPGEVAAASSPSEPDVAAAKVAEEKARAPGEVADDVPSTSSELHGGRGAGQSDEVTTPLSLGLGGHGREDGEQEAGGALMLMALGVEASTQSSLDSNAGGVANEVATPPSSPEAGGCAAAAMMATEDEDEAAAELVEALACSWTEHELEAAQGLVMLSESNIGSPVDILTDGVYQCSIS